MMKKILKLSLATAAVMTAFSTVAFAADVSIYGKVEPQMIFKHRSTANGSTDSFSMEDGSSRFGINVREKLSDDVSVKVYLENGFKVDTGALNTEGNMFNRRAILALHSDTYGEIGFGRMGAVDTIFGPYGQGMAALCPVRTGYGPDFSIDGMFASELPQSSNSVSYISPEIGGFKLAATYSFEMQDQESSNESENDRNFGGVLTYTVGDLTIVGGGSTIHWGDGSASTKYDNSEQYFLGATYQVTPDVKLYAAAQYVEDWRNMFYYGWMAGADAKDGMDGKTYMVGARVSPAANHTLIASYAYFDGDTNVGADDEASRHRLNLGYEYNFSRRTMASMMFAYSKNNDALENIPGRIAYEHEYQAIIGLQHWF